MNIRPKLLASIFGITVLSGCGGGGSPGQLVVLALSPIIVPIAYALDRSSIVQPVTVVSSSGEQLTPDFTDAAEEKFTVSEETIVCNGFHSLDKPTGKVSLVCNKELKGEAIITDSGIRKGINMLFFHLIDIRIGPKSAPRAYNGDSRYLTEVTFRCIGLYDTTKGRVDSFLIDCGDDGKAAISPVEGGEEPSEFKVWIHPPSQPLSEDEAAWLHPRLEEPAKPLAELKARADEGDAEAMYRYGSRLRGLEETWRWHCRAAHKGHAKAQYSLASYYDWGLRPVQFDIIQSYVWRSLSLKISTLMTKC